MDNTKNKKTEEKKGGRKPKGGKIISKSRVIFSNEQPVSNIILHLKCSLHDLDEYNENYNKQLSDPLFYTPIVPPDIKTYNTSDEKYFHYETENNENHCDLQKDYAYSNTIIQNTNSLTNATTSTNNFICSICLKNQRENKNIETNVLFEKEEEPSNNTNEQYITNEINYKLKNLKIQLFKNKINEKKSACFWCTFDFDNPECYIISFENDDNTYSGYGSFCRPECAVAYLMKEPIDDSIKFERYNLINQIYGKIYNYKKNIKPAPNPYYLLDKFYGNLTIQEYRKLLKSEHLLMIVEKPLTRILPELHEENEEIYYSNSVNKSTFHTGLNSNELQYKVKKSSEKKKTKTKTSIIREHFGL